MQKCLSIQTQNKKSYILQSLFIVQKKNIGWIAVNVIKYCNK